ncbi:hypothetical protein ACGFNU_20970 [Spirillospora sp. NPDC048911]|uniref:hypothetical protein n=1 Tax=Spirillospora sp. NPDC048911 TaxID=3364527 RepID=UPI003712078B
MSCEAYADRVFAGESVEEVAADDEVTRDEVLLACWWVGLNDPRRDSALRRWAEVAHASLARAWFDEVPDPPARDQ